MYASKLGAKIRWKGAPDFILRRAEVRLDGNSIWDSGEKPLVDELIKVSERPIKPGTHSVTVRLEVRPGQEEREGERGSRLRARAHLRRQRARRETHDHRDHGRRRRRPARIRARDRDRDRIGEVDDLGSSLALADAGRLDVGGAKAAPRRRRPIPWASYLADLEKAGILTEDKEPATLERLKSRAGRGRRRPGDGQRRGRERPAVPASSNRRATRKFDYAPEYANAELTLARALIQRGRLQVGRALPAARAGARDQVAVLRARLPRHGRHRAGDARAGRDPGRARSLRAGLDRARRRRCPRDSEQGARVPGRQGRLRGGRHRARRVAVLRTSTASRASTRRRCISAA